MVCRSITDRQTRAFIQLFACLMEHSCRDGDDRHDRYQQEERDCHQAVSRITRATTACIQGFVIQGLLYAIHSILYHAFLSERSVLHVHLVCLYIQQKEVQAETCASDDDPGYYYQSYQRNQNRFHLVFPFAGFLPACVVFILHQNRRIFQENSKWVRRCLSCFKGNTCNRWVLQNYRYFALFASS